MKYGIKGASMVSPSKVFLDQNNPRHEPFEDQEEAINYLCKNDKVLAIAKDIVLLGLNPLELFAIIKDENNTYFTAEGNRRLCAIKLLNDPDLAPSSQQKEFKKTAKNWKPIKELFCVEFKNREEVRIWLDRIHAGENEGRGRRQWNADQKARNSGYDKNNLALQILDIAEKQGIITAEERKGRLSTVQRYLGNPVMRDTLGLNEPSAEQASTDVVEKDFNIMLTKFVSDVAQKKITTRVDSDGIKKYSRNLSKSEGVTGARGTRRELTKTVGAKKARPQKPTEPERPEKIEPNRKLEQSLKAIPSYKLQRLYFSLCDIPLENHTPLLAVGAWTFLETLTALNGRKTNDPFSNFLSADRLAKMGFGDKKKTKGIRTVIQRISDMGNVTKHDEKSTYLNQEQLANDFETLSSLLVALSDGAKGKT